MRLRLRSSITSLAYRAFLTWMVFWRTGQRISFSFGFDFMHRTLRLKLYPKMKTKTMQGPSIDKRASSVSTSSRCLDSKILLLWLAVIKPFCLTSWLAHIFRILTRWFSQTVLYCLIVTVWYRNEIFVLKSCLASSGFYFTLLFYDGSCSKVVPEQRKQRTSVFR